MEGHSGGSSDTAAQKKSCCRRVPWGSVLTYLGLYSVTVAYLFLGGLVFHLLEHPHEQNTTSRVIVSRDNFLRELRRVSNVNADSAQNWTFTATELLTDYEFELQGYWKLGWRAYFDNTKWDYLSACFYCLTVVSTIGYGNITPATQMGKLTTVFYAILGIPLFFLFLAKAGDIVSIPLRYINGVIIKSCKSCPDCHESCTGLESVSRFGSAVSIFSSTFRHSIKPEDVDSTYDRAEDVAGTGSGIHEEPTTQTTQSYSDIPGVPDHDDNAVLCRVEDWTRSNEAHFPTSTVATQTDSSLLESYHISNIEKSHRRGNGLSSAGFGGKNTDDVRVTYKEDGVVISDVENNIPTRKDTYTPPKKKKEEIEVPISILLLLQLTYLLLGAALLNATQETWTFMDSLYFSTVTFTTVGFGDLIPDYDDGNILRTTWFMSIYIVIGLILMSSCIMLSQQRVVRFIKVVMKGCCRSQTCRNCRRSCRKCCR